MCLIKIGIANCGELPVVPNGTLTSSSYGAGSRASLTCNYPFSAVGSLTYSCNEKGDWIGTGRCSKWQYVVNVNLEKCLQ